MVTGIWVALALFFFRLADDALSAETWNTVSERYFEGELSADEIAIAFDHLIEYMEGNPGDHLIPWIRTLLQASLARGDLSHEQYVRLCEAYYIDWLRVTASDRAQRDRGLHFTIKGVTGTSMA